MIYIHIPFCVRKCNYCAFNSKVSNAGEIENYGGGTFTILKIGYGRIFAPVRK